MNLIECGTCGYPLTPEEQTTLVEINGKMHKPWVGLTDDELTNIVANQAAYGPWDDFSFAHAIEAKLKEKNA